MLRNERTDPAGGGIGSGDLLGSEIEPNPTDDPRQPLRAALKLAAVGWRVLPCRAYDVDDRRRAKAPLTRNGHLDATTDTAVIIGWWERWPDAIIGARVPDALAVIDIDPRNGGGLAELEKVGETTLPATLTVWSGRADAGRHLYFHRPAGRLTSTRLPAGIDLEVDGYLIMPPSLHPATGNPYVWDVRPTAEMPPGLIDLLTRKVSPPAAAVARATTSRRLDALLGKVATATPGDRNKILYWAACRLQETGDLDAHRDVLAQAAAAAGLSTTETVRTISSAGAR